MCFKANQFFEIIFHRVTSHLIEDESYWEKCSVHRWPLCTPADHGGNWKRMYFERHVQELIENFTPTISDIQQVILVLTLLYNNNYNSLN